jgi:hypothetical protein
LVLVSWLAPKLGLSAILTRIDTHLGQGVLLDRKDCAVKPSITLTFVALLTSFGCSAQTLNATSNCDVEGAAQSSSQITRTDSSPSVVQCGSGADNGSVSATSYSQADYGSLHAAAGASAGSFINVGGANYWLSARNWGVASFSDYVTIASPGHIGVGDLTFSVYRNETVSTVVSASAPGFAVASSGVLTNLDIGGHLFQSVLSSGASINGASGVSTSSSTTYVDGVVGADPNGYFTYTVPFTFDTAFLLQMDVTAETIVNPVIGDATGGAMSDATHSFDWAGISGVTSAGQAVPYLLTSASGTDWNESMVLAVPEPATWALFALGCCLVAGSKARTKLRYDFRLSHQL